MVLIARQKDNYMRYLGLKIGGLNSRPVFISIGLNSRPVFISSGLNSRPVFISSGLNSGTILIIGLNMLECSTNPAHLQHIPREQLVNFWFLVTGSVLAAQEMWPHFPSQGPVTLNVVLSPEWLLLSQVSHDRLDIE